MSVLGFETTVFKLKADFQADGYVAWLPWIIVARCVAAKRRSIYHHHARIVQIEQVVYTRMHLKVDATALVLVGKSSVPDIEAFQLGGVFIIQVLSSIIVMIKLPLPMVAC